MNSIIKRSETHMDIEFTIVREISQAEKYKHCMLSLAYMWSLSKINDNKKKPAHRNKENFAIARCWG